MTEDSDAFTALLKVLNGLTFDKYSTKFHVLSTKYKHDGDEAVGVDVLVPRHLKSTNRQVSVMVRIHGGFLVTGSSLYPPWFNTWILDYAIAHDTVIISPNYRLLPEVDGMAILDDMDAFWSWLHGSNVDRLMQANGWQNLKLDLSKLLLVGESAGGYLATQLALSHCKQVKALIALYPMLDLKSDFYTKNYSKPIMNVTNRPESMIEQHIQHNKSWISHCETPYRLELAFSIVQNGRFLDFFDPGSNKSDSDSSKLYPMERLENPHDADAQDEGANLPEIFIFHGLQDSAVPVESSITFVQKLKDRRRKARLQSHFQDGDHGFDFDATLDTPWLAEGLKPITAAWLGSRSLLNNDI